MVFFAGVAALGHDGEVIGPGSLEQQLMAIYDEMEGLLADEGLSFSSIVQMTTFIKNDEDVSEFYRVRAIAYEHLYPQKMYPPNATVVCKLADPDLLIEVQFIAAA